MTASTTATKPDISFSKSTFQKLARTAQINRVSEDAYQLLNLWVTEELNEILKKSQIVMEGAEHKTLMLSDVD